MRTPSRWLTERRDLSVALCTLADLSEQKTERREAAVVQRTQRNQSKLLPNYMIVLKNLTRQISRREVITIRQKSKEIFLEIQTLRNRLRIIHQFEH